MTNIAICGASGHMGRVIADIIANRADCTVCAGIDKITKSYADFPIVETPDQLPEKPDVIIDFSHPSTLNGLLGYCMTNGVPLVIATTGYSEEQIMQIRKAAESIPVFFTFNMSLGINLLAELAKKAAAVLEGQFDIEIIEKHHNQKLDAPSGTALALADACNDALDEKYEYCYGRADRREKRPVNEIGISAVRGGNIVGEHEVIFAGMDEVITIKHTAYSKGVFGKGAVEAAKFLSGKPAGLYDMKEVIADKN